MRAPRMLSDRRCSEIFSKLRIDLLVQLPPLEEIQQWILRVNTSYFRLSRYQLRLFMDVMRLGTSIVCSRLKSAPIYEHLCPSLTWSAGEVLVFDLDDKIEINQIFAALEMKSIDPQLSFFIMDLFSPPSFPVMLAGCCAGIEFMIWSPAHCAISLA